MTLRFIRVEFPQALAEKVRSIADSSEPIYFLLEDSENAGQTRTAEFLVATDNAQTLVDDLQSSFEGDDGWRINVIAVEATLPRLSEEEVARQKETATVTSREEIYEEISSGANVDTNFIVLTLVSALVATIGLNESNVAVVIGAMVIAPLLGPNLAFSLGVALGDLALVRKAAIAAGVGIAVTIGLAILVGLIVPLNMESTELLRRSDVWLSDILLALASGTAAALSVTSRLASTLVGVMVAVALMPPAAAAGFLLGGGERFAAVGAFILLLTNIVSINLASQLVFLWKGVRPRKWLERRTAKNAVRTNLIVWGLLLVVMAAVIYAWAWFTE
jgi:uncharacterized hydrophobic protein (TIGR00341 family)